MPSRLTPSSSRPPPWRRFYQACVSFGRTGIGHPYVRFPCTRLGAPLCFAQPDMPVLRQRIGVALYVDSLTAADACARLPVSSLADVAAED